MTRRRQAGHVGVDAFRAALGGVPKEGDDAMQGMLKQMLEERQAQDRIMSQIMMSVVGAELAERGRLRADMRDRASRLEDEALIILGDNPGIRAIKSDVIRKYRDDWRGWDKDQQLGGIMAWKEASDILRGGRIVADDPETVIDDNLLSEFMRYTEIRNDAEHFRRGIIPPPLDPVNAEAFAIEVLPGFKIPKEQMPAPGVFEREIRRLTGIALRRQR